jgi:lactate racemase
MMRIIREFTPNLQREDTMRAEVFFGDETLAFELPDERLIGSWEGPKGRPREDVFGLLAASLESPRDFPPLRQAVVPGDHVVIAWDPEVPEPACVLAPLIEVLRRGGVDAETIRIVTTATGSDSLDSAVPDGIEVSVHDPTDRTQLAYLAATSAGRRIYLNRYVTDADLVVPVGCLRFDGSSGYRGPWSTFYPGLSDEEALKAGQVAAGSSEALKESDEVSWLLGSQFHVGVLPAKSGVLAVVAGLHSSVLREGVRRVDEAWRFRPSRRADLVVVGVGGAHRPGGIDDLAAGVTTACRMVRRGGKIVVLSRVSGELGVAMRRLLEMGDPEAALGRLRGLEGEADFLSAKRLAKALSWASLYVLSDLGEETVEDLGMIALGKPEEARRLVANAPSTLLVSGADRVNVPVLKDDE